jgi:hypothetical protein
MGMLLKVIKIAFVLAITVPLAIIALTLALGIFGAVAALAFLVLRVTIVCLLVYGGIRLAMSLLGRSGKPRVETPKPLAAAATPPAPYDPHYEAALRELDREFPASNTR